LLLAPDESPESHVAAFRVGADDCLRRPTLAPVLAIRILACIRRASSSGVLVRLGRLTVDLTGKAVYVDAEKLELTKLEIAIMMKLGGRVGEVVSRAELLTEVWGVRRDGSNIMDANMARLRSKLGPVKAQIETVRGEGYRLIRA
jgi:DNA-binding response OmpR family regulator